MSVKKVESENEQSKNKQSTDVDYQALFDKENEEFENQKEQENPDGRLSWLQLYQLFVLIEGHDPRQKQQRGQQGLAGKRSAGDELFVQKLKSNAHEAQQRFVVLNGIMPTPEDQDKAQAYFDSKQDIIKDYTGGIEDISNFSEHELKGIVGGREKMDALEAELEHLDDKYEDITEILKEQNKFKSKPLAKCNFDKITMQDTKGMGLSANELRILDPMLSF